MSKSFIDPLLKMLLILCAWPLTSWAIEQDKAKWQLVAIQSMENCFGDRPALCQFQLVGPARQTVRVQWQVMIERRIAQRGSLRLTTGADDKPSDVSFEFRPPPVTAGVIAGGKLRVQLSDDEHDDLLTKEFPLWIYHENPFETEFAWIKQMPIEIADPEHRLAERLGELGFLGKLGVSLAKHKRVLIVAQMEAWDASVIQRIDQTLRDGGRVLCLAVTGGQLRPHQALQSQATDGPDSRPVDRLQPPDVRAANLDWLKQLDTRLSGEGLTVKGRGRIEYGADERLSFTIQSNRSGWTFIEVGFDAMPTWMPDHKTAFTAAKYGERPRLVYCGLDLMSRWQASPTPRYLFAKLLERMCFEPEINSTSKELP